MRVISVTAVELSKLSSTLREGGVDVDLDLTMVGQIVLFLLLMFALKPMLFDPMLKLFEKREERIDGAKKKARDKDIASANALSKYEAAMSKARAAGNAERDVLRADGLKTENEILAKVRASTAETLAQGRKLVGDELATARQSLKTETTALGRELASRALGREVQ